MSEIRVFNLTDRQFQIITAAGVIMTKSGIQGLTIKKLAAEMSFSEPAIYRHFKSKEEVILAMLSFLQQDMENKFLMIDSSLESELKFRSIFNSQIDFFTENQHFVVVLFSDGLLESSELVRNQILEIMFTRKKYLLPIIQEGQALGHFRNDISADQLMHISMGAFRLQMYKWRVSEFTIDINVATNNLIETIINLIKK